VLSNKAVLPCKYAILFKLLQSGFFSCFTCSRSNFDCDATPNAIVEAYSAPQTYSCDIGKERGIGREGKGEGKEDMER